MPIKAYNPTTPGRRGMTSQDMSEVTTRKPLKSLIKSKKQNAGRNNTGRITVRHRGGGVLAAGGILHKRASVFCRLQLIGEIGCGCRVNRFRVLSGNCQNSTEAGSFNRGGHTQPVGIVDLFIIGYAQTVPARVIQYSVHGLQQRFRRTAFSRYQRFSPATDIHLLRFR